MDKLIINAAITGMVPQKSQNPHVPITVDEIVADVKRCYDAGATIVHVHAREEDGTPTYRGDVYGEIFRQVRKSCPDVMISASTSGRLWKEFSKRSESLCPAPDLLPDFGSLTLGSMNFPKQASVNEPDMIVALASKMDELGIVPEWECFELGMIEYAQYLIAKNILKKPFYCNLLLGSLGTMSATAFNLATMVRALPPHTTWAAAGIGQFQFQVNSMAITMGGHVRVGLEDNLFYDKEKKQPATNCGLIERLVKLAEAAGRKVATPLEAREIIGMPVRINQPVSRVSTPAVHV
jgi:uncharacterized protein (DUF849 family)